MSTRTYTRTFLAVVTQTYTVSDADLGAEDVAVLDDFDRGFDVSLCGDVDEILCDFDADHEDMSAVDDRQLTIKRTR